MRRLSDAEMAELIALARQGRKGPAAALDALWELILHEAEGLSLAEAAERGFYVSDYAIPADQAVMIRDAMVQRRRLPPRVVAGFWAMWGNLGPADY